MVCEIAVCGWYLLLKLVVSGLMGHILNGYLAAVSVAKNRSTLSMNVIVIGYDI